MEHENSFVLGLNRRGDKQKQHEMGGGAIEIVTDGNGSTPHVGRQPAVNPNLEAKATQGNIAVLLSDSEDDMQLDARGLELDADIGRQIA